MRQRKQTVMDRLWDEHINLPGVIGVIVTRAYAYRYLVEAGYDPRERGFGSVDYMVFAAPVQDAPLTDLTDPSTAKFLADVQQKIRGDK